jgi:hypothetical protein
MYAKEEELYKFEKKLKNNLFKIQDEAKEHARYLRTHFPYHKITTSVVPVYEGFISAETSEMVLQGYKVKLEYERNYFKIEKAINRKGKYIIATNIPEVEKNDIKIYDSYQRRNANIESCFRQIKSAQFLGKGIQALMSIVTLGLFVNNVGQLVLRKGLNSTKQKVKNFAGKDIKNPTFAMVGKLMRRVSIITIGRKGHGLNQIVDLREDLLKVINLFGPKAQKIYGFP